jgi:hypothetical protein
LDAYTLGHRQSAHPAAATGLWISGQSEFLPQPKGGEKMQLDRKSSEKSVRAPPSASRPAKEGTSHAESGRGGSITSPLPKKTSEYQLPEGTSLDDAQALPRRGRNPCLSAIDGPPDQQLLSMS